MDQQARSLRFDYNDEVFRQGVEAQAMDCSILLPEYRDVHPRVADRFAAAQAAPVLDMGCGPTKLGALLDERSVSWVGLDAAIRRLKLGHGPRVLGNAIGLPFADGCFGGVAALYMLYHFDDPSVPVAEAFRVLRPGGLFAACAPSRYDSPELANLLPLRAPDTFDAEIAPELLGRIFEIERIDSWDVALYRFPDRQALWNNLIATGTVPDPDQAWSLTERVEFPLWVTKRGAVVWGRKA